MAIKPDPVAAIMLAGGISARMGTVNKLHLAVDGVSLLRWSVQPLLAADLGEIVIVVGHDHEKTAVLVDDLPVQLVYNADYLNGQMTSVHCGLSALRRRTRGVMVALGDQPGLTGADINYLIEAFNNRESAEVVVPFFQGLRGNPIVISNQCRKEILAGQHNLGCRRFIDKNPHLVQKVEMTTPAVVTDLDTPEDYRRYCKALNALSLDTPQQAVS